MQHLKHTAPKTHRPALPTPTHPPTTRSCDPTDEAAAWVAYMGRLFVMGALLSLAVSTVFHLTVERPLVAAFRPESKAKRG